MAPSDNDEFFEDDRADNTESRRQKVKSSSGTNWGKILLILLAVGGVSLAICCGVGYFFASRAFQMETDPIKITAMQKEIVEINVPQDLQPQMGMNMNLGIMTMKMVMYNPNMAHSMLLMQMQIAGQTEEQMQQAFRQQAGQQQQNAQFQMESSETKNLKIDGQDRSFVFAKGKITAVAGNAPTSVMMITGMFPSKGGMGYIQYSIDEEKYDEAAVIQMLESIHK